jgi:hypothetical protein
MKESEKKTKTVKRQFLVPKTIAKSQIPTKTRTQKSE